jgi:hypothetical protein
MLDFEKLLKIINISSDRIFRDDSDVYRLARQTWQSVVWDESFVETIKNLKNQNLIPAWSGRLDEVVSIDQNPKKYFVLAVDGSQIYPDRHEFKSNCFLVNTGGCLFSYGDCGSVKFFSYPELFFEDQVESQGLPVTKEIVDLFREELEFKFAFQKSVEFLSRKAAGSNRSNFLCLFDGSLIFWHLQNSSSQIQKRFLGSYLSLLEQFFNEKILVAGYLSLPKNRELVNLLRVKLCDKSVGGDLCAFKQKECPCSPLFSISDRQVVGNFLKPFMRTSLFFSQTSIVKSYPDSLKPVFFYVDVGQEIARVEVPAWVANDSERLDFVCQAVVDQSLKGQGYPISLAEAHNSAVVKEQDKRMFYQMLYKIGIGHGYKSFISQKSMKKRRLGV